jgi:hypothetical protein
LRLSSQVILDFSQELGLPPEKVLKKIQDVYEASIPNM